MKIRILVCSIGVTMVIAAGDAMGQESKTPVIPVGEIKTTNPHHDFRILKVDSLADFLWFKREAELRIKEYQDKIAELKEKKPPQSKGAREKFDKKLLVMEKKNYDLKDRIANSDTLKSQKWPTFKREFTHDMDELGVALRDIDMGSTK